MKLLLRALCVSLLLCCGAHPDFDCGMRRLAYDFGRQLLPRQGQFESLYYALNLNSPDCPTVASPLEGGAAARDGAAAANLSSSGGGTGALFVDPVGGDDANVGTEVAPIRSLQAALAIAPKAASIVLRAGTHFLEAPLLLDERHSGLTLRAYPGEKPVVSGGKKVTVHWEAYDVAAPIAGQQGQGTNIYKANIKGQVEDVPGLQLNGARATRARYPNLPAGIEASPGYGSMIDGGDAAWTPPQFDRFGPVKHYTDNTEAHFRNTAADDWFTRYMIGVGGLCSVYDPPVSYWCSERPSGGGAFPFRTPSGVAPKPGKLPNAPYKDVSDMVINVWRPGRWANWMFQVADYDPSSDNFTFGAGGNQGARGEDTGGDFFVENVFEELDSPGEFYFSKATGDLYLFYNGTGPPPEDMEVVVPQLQTLVNVTGTQWSPARGITIDGLIFKATRYTYMEPHGVPSAGDWALDRTSAVFLQGTEGTTVQNCVFERLDGNALMISGYNRNTTVQDSDFAYIGGNAIISWGYTNETENSGFPYYTPRTNFPEAGVDGTDGNHPQFNVILRNLVREVGLYEKQSSFYMQAKTAQSTISGNVFFNGPRAGVNYNDGFGGGDELSYNLVFSACRESGDHGPFNSWDRQPYLTSVRTGEPSMVMAWREIHHNFLVDNYSPQESIDNDDGSCYYKSHHNFLVYGGQGMKNDYGGHDNHHFENLYAYVGVAMVLVNTLEGHEDRFYNNTAVLTGADVGGAVCSGAKTQMSGNRYFTRSGEISLCGKSLADAQKDGLDYGSTVSKMPGDNIMLGWAKALLSIGGGGRPAASTMALHPPLGAHHALLQV